MREAPLVHGATPSIILRPATVPPSAPPEPAPSAPPARPEVPARDAPSAPPSSSPAQPPADAPNFAALQILFLTDAPLDLIGTAVKAAALPGVHAVFISGRAGMTQVGQIPSTLDVNLIHELTEEFAGRAGSTTSLFEATRAVSVTVHREDCAIAVFVRDGVRLTAVLDARGFVAGVRERLVRATAYLAGAPTAE
jgi:hypothetical protein